MIKKKYTKKQVQEAHKIIKHTINRKMKILRSFLEEMSSCPCVQKLHSMMCHADKDIYQCLECGDLFKRTSNGTINFNQLKLSDEKKEAIIDKINSQRRDEE